MTNQELFDRVAKHLLTQNRKSVAGSTCMYRALDGARCAAGCLVSDDLYRESMEGNSVGFLPPGLFGIAARQVELLCALQYVHDCLPVEDWCRALARCARTFRLKADILVG